MLFNSQAYLYFFLAVFACYWAIPWRTGRVWLLVGASIYFYAQWSQMLAFLVVSTTVMDYLLARGMDATQRPRLRWLLLMSSLGVNLGLLCYFKYANFFLDALRDSLRSIGASASIPALELIIPFGISFYTFEAISYSIDVYRRRIPAERDLANFMLFILFFPHLVAGPIVRGRDFLPQTHVAKRLNWLRVQVGVQLFLMGLFKKVVLADRLALFCDPVFADPASYGTRVTFWAVFAFAGRIYCDFSGYSDMALGSAHLLGYKLTQNFAAPYLALNISDFWRRWHISLSSWLRDYVFIPLGGSKGGQFATCRNLMITMTLGGLWHGAAWSYVLWGVLHGLYLVIHRLFRAACDRSTRATAWRETVVARCLAWLLTFLCVTFTWILFQPSLKNAGIMASHLVSITRNTLDVPAFRIVPVLLLGVMLVHVFSRWAALRRATLRLPAPLVGTAYAVLFMLILILTPDSTPPFIYFQF